MLKNGINSMAMSLAAYHEEMQHNIDQATSDLRETLEQMEIQNVELDLAKKRAQEADKRHRQGEAVAGGSACSKQCQKHIPRQYVA